MFADRMIDRRPLVLMLVAGWLLLLAAPAAAHARYVSSDPAKDGTVGSPPSQVYVEFSEPVTEGSTLEITDPCGRSVATGDTQVGPTSVTRTMSGSAQGGYTVFWRAMGADGHPTEGEFTFSSSGGEPCPGEEPPPEEPNKQGGGSGERGESGNIDPSSAVGDAPEGSGEGGGTHPGGHASRGEKSSDGNRKERSAAQGGTRDGGRSSSEPPSGIAQGPGSGDVETPSAIEDIPVDGLLFTFAIATLIGAAGGKIFVSLSGGE